MVILIPSALSSTSFVSNEADLKLIPDVVLLQSGGPVSLATIVPAGEHQLAVTAGGTPDRCHGDASRAPHAVGDQSRQRDTGQITKP